jgi:hypothetical protein
MGLGGQIRFVVGCAASLLLILQSSAWAGGAAVNQTAHAADLPPNSGHPASLALNGSTGYAEAPAAPDLNPTADWTLELWLKDADVNGFDHAYRYLLNKGDGVAAVMAGDHPDGPTIPNSAPDHRGTDFWLVFTENLILAEAELSVQITGETATTGTVSIPVVAASSRPLA